MEKRQALALQHETETLNKCPIRFSLSSTFRILNVTETEQQMSDTLQLAVVIPKLQAGREGQSALEFMPFSSSSQAGGLIVELKYKSLTMLRISNGVTATFIGWMPSRSCRIMSIPYSNPWLTRHSATMAGLPMELLPEGIVGEIPARETQVTAGFLTRLSVRRVNGKLKRIGHPLRTWTD